MLGAEEYKKAYERERQARKIAEKLLNKKTREVYDQLQEIKRKNDLLETQKKELVASYVQLQTAHSDIKKAQQQLIQSEKMASIGQIAAGIAHEINNPVAFVLSNLHTLDDYVSIIETLLEKHQAVLDPLLQLNDQPNHILPSALKQFLTTQKAQLQAIEAFSSKEDIPFILSDVNAILEESSLGMLRVKDIVTNLKSFAHSGDNQKTHSDINECLDTAFKVTWNELKYTIKVIRNYGDIPKIPCNTAQLSQVFMNMIINAKDACHGEGELEIKTFIQGKHVVILFKDTGEGIPKEKQHQIFDPFFTSKPVGKGTGLGLSISYGIIENHQGRIEVESTEGEGTSFRIFLPIEHSDI